MNTPQHMINTANTRPAFNWQTAQSQPQTIKQQFILKLTDFRTKMTPQNITIIDIQQFCSQIRVHILPAKSLQASIIKDLQIRVVDSGRPIGHTVCKSVGCIRGRHHYITDLKGGPKLREKMSQQELIISS